MSLGHALSSVSRARVPETLLVQCKPSDRVVVENILTVLQDTIEGCSVQGSTLRKTGSAYVVTVPCAGSEVTMGQLRKMQGYSPARISEIRIGVCESRLTVTLSIADESAPLAYSEIDVVRVCKRNRWDR